ncbi:MAG: PRC-barrel domain-containing protein [Candidatus Woesearchaeota archaeon]
MSDTNWITTDDFLGIDVIDSHGAFVGVVDKIFLDKKLIEIVGISVDKGFLKAGFVIGKDYIERITPYAIFLNTKPFVTIKGLLVFDSVGALVGEVHDIVLQDAQNKIKELIVKSKKLKKTITITQADIDSIEKNIVLKKKITELS